MVTGKNNEPASAPLLPPDPAQSIVPKPGEQWMAKHPSIGGQWQVVTIVDHPAAANKALAQFADNTLYEVDDLEMSGPMKPQNAPEPAATAPGAAPNATVSPLQPDYEAFRKVLTTLNNRSLSLFKMPLSVLLVMVTRLSIDQETEITGRNIDFGNLQTFVPSDESFDQMIENYLYEVQRREQGNSPE